MKLRPASWSVSSGILPKPNTAYDISFFAKASKDYSPRLHPTNELVGIRRRRIKGKYVVLSETTGRVFGRYRTKPEALKRLRQIEFFEHRKGKGRGE